MSGSIPKKIVNDALAPGKNVGPNIKQIVKAITAKYDATPGGEKGTLFTRGKAPTSAFNPGKAQGFVPNFSPLTSAISREMQAGVPASAIRVGSSSALKSAGNPGGVGVYNTIHEPGGLNQGIGRSRSKGKNPRTHGAASGFVPNFRDPMSIMMSGGELNALEKNNAAWDKISKEGVKSSETTAKAAGKFEKASNGLLMASMMFSMAGPAMGSALGARPSTQGGISAGANILAMAGMGAAMTAGTGPGMLLGALGGAAVGAVTSMGDLQMAFGEEGRMADAKQAKDRADAVAEGLTAVSKALKGLEEIDFMTTAQKMEAYLALQEKLNKVQSDLRAGGGDTEAAKEAFYTAKAKTGNVQDFMQLSPKREKLG